MLLRTVLCRRAESVGSLTRPDDAASDLRSHLPRRRLPPFRETCHQRTGHLWSCSDKLQRSVASPHTFMARHSSEERRRKTRSKLPRMIRVRPSEPTLEDFDEILPTLNSSRESVYFVPQNGIFAPNMRVFVTFPYDSSPGSINQEFLGKVTRVDKLP